MQRRDADEEHGRSGGRGRLTLASKTRTAERDQERPQQRGILQPNALVAAGAHRSMTPADFIAR